MIKNLIPLETLNDPRVAVYREMKGKDLSGQGIFVAESERVVGSLLRSDLEIISCLTTESFYTRRGKPYLSKLAKKGIPVYLGKLEEVEKVIGFRFHQGILVVGKCPPRVGIEALALKEKNFARSHLLVALNGIIDPQNVGLIVRNSAAFGATAIIADKRTGDPYYRKSIRVSTGSIFTMPVAYEPELAPKLKWLKKKYGTKIIMTCPAKRNKNIEKVDLSGNVCVVLGNEEEGVDASVARAADVRVKIPITGKVDSINVACASSVFLYQASIQR